MKAKSLVWALLPALMSFSACKSPTPSQAGAAASKALGIPVQVRAADNDLCAKSLIAFLLKDYQSLDATTRAQARAQLAAKYPKGVILSATETTGRIEGRYLRLQLLHDQPSAASEDGFVTEVAEDILVADETLLVSGTAAITGVDKADALTLTPRSMEWDGTDVTGITYSRDLFNEISSAADFDRLSSQLEVTSEPQSLTQCAAPVVVKALL